MLKRILFIFIYASTFPVFLLSSLVSAIIMPVIALLIYIIKGDKDDKLIDFMYSPVIWALDLPSKIAGID